MKFSQLPMKDQIIVVLIFGGLWFLSNVIGCAIGLFLFKG